MAPKHSSARGPCGRDRGGEERLEAAARGAQRRDELAGGSARAGAHLVLLLEDEPEAEADLGALLEVRLHPQHGAERLLGVPQALGLLRARQHERSVPLVQEADAVPQVGVAHLRPSE